MIRSLDRYTEIRNGGADPVGSLAARRVPPELLEWIVEEAARERCTQRSVVEKALKEYLNYRDANTGRAPYEALPKHEGKAFRMYISLDLLRRSFEIIKQDGVFNGDFVTAVLRYATNERRSS